MNLYVIASWYPSESNSTYGIFIKEQVEMMSHLRPDWKIGLSLWGQGDYRKLIWAGDHIFNLPKLWNHWNDSAHVHSTDQVSFLYHPALTWTKRVLRGNIRKIISSNDENFKKFIDLNGKPDLISVHAGYPGAFIAEYLSSKYEVPYHIHLHMGGFLFENLLQDLGSMKNDFLKAIKRASLVSCVSQFQKEDLSKYLEEIEIIHNPVDIDFFTPSDDQGSGAVAIGRLEDEKGFDLLIEAIKELNIDLRIVGEGSNRDKLMKRAGELGLNDRIVFTGPVDRIEVRDLIRRCKFLVLPSTYETFGMVLLEAMSCGKPVVATKCGGPEEIVTTDCGILCDPTVIGLRKGIQSMMESVELFQEQKIREYVRDNFSPEIWIDQIEKHFKSIT